MANDYTPRPDARFHARRSNCVTCVNGRPAGLALAAGDVVDLNAGAAAWTADYPAHPAAPENAKLRRREDNNRWLSPSIPFILWLLTTLREKLIKTGAKVVRHARHVTFQMA